MLAALERALGGQVEVGRGRLRAVWLRLRGAVLGRRTRIGARCVVRRPWCIQFGERCEVEHQVHIKATADTTRVRVGNDVFVGFNSEFDVTESLEIGNGVLIAPGCFITDHSHRFSAATPIPQQGSESRAVVLEDDVWLGAHAVVLPGVRIGRGAIVAAGAVVNRDVESMSIVGGVPAVVIGRRE